jgi:SnoaL-like domain
MRRKPVSDFQAIADRVGRGRDSRSELNYAIYHDRYRRTGDGWKFTERVYEVRYHDQSPLAGAPPRAAGAPASAPAQPPATGGHQN